MTGQDQENQREREKESGGSGGLHDRLTGQDDRSGGSDAEREAQKYLSGPEADDQPPPSAPPFE